MKNDTLKEIMDIDIKNIKEKKRIALKNHVLLTLTKITDLIYNDKYDEAAHMLCYSPAGDGEGFNNWFINFDWEENGDPKDINDVITILKSLK